LNAKGVTLKPSEVILKDFIKRLRTLNKDTITDILFEKMNEFIESEEIKLLTKCLYMIEEILSNKIEGYDIVFKNKLDLFENLLNGDNKKIIELSNNIISTLSGSKNKSNKNISEVIIVNFRTLNRINLIL
jgi:hypothetical protein